MLDGLGSKRPVFASNETPGGQDGRRRDEKRLCRRIPEIDLRAVLEGGGPRGDRPPLARTGRSHGFDRRQRGAESDRPERRGVGHVRPKWPEIEARRHDWAEIADRRCRRRGKRSRRDWKRSRTRAPSLSQVVIRLGDPDRARVCGTKAREEHRRANVLKRRQHVRMVGFVEDEEPGPPHRSARASPKTSLCRPQRRRFSPPCRECPSCRRVCRRRSRRSSQPALLRGRQRP